MPNVTSEAADEVEGDDAEAVELYAGGAATLLEQAAPAVRRVGTEWAAATTTTAASAAAVM